MTVLGPLPCPGIGSNVAPNSPTDGLPHTEASRRPTTLYAITNSAELPRKPKWSVKLHIWSVRGRHSIDRRSHNKFLAKRSSCSVYPQNLPRITPEDLPEEDLVLRKMYLEPAHSSRTCSAHSDAGNTPQRADSDRGSTEPSRV